MKNKTDGSLALAANVKLIEASKPDNAKKKVAAYVRVSSNSDDQENSFAAQISYYTNMLSKNEEVELVDIYADEGLTGLKAEHRDEFQRMLLDCNLGKIDRILTKSISRFSRNITVTLATVRELKAIGVTVFFEKENIDTENMSSEMMLTVFSIVAQNESLAISSNMQMGCRMRMKNGTYKQSTEPLGYQLIDKNLVVDHEEAEIVKRIFTDYLSGKSITKITAELNADGVTRRDGRSKWHYSGINLILKNERYIGDQLLQKKYTPDTLPLALMRNYGQCDMYYIENTHDAIISKEVFEAVNAMMNLKKEHFNSNNPAKGYAFTQKIVCAECGRKFRKKVYKSNDYWNCRGRDKQLTDCKVTQIAEVDIETAFIRLYNKLKSGSERILRQMLQRLLDLKAIKNQGNEELIEINNQIGEITEQSHVLNGLRAKGIIDSAFCISQQNELNGQMEKLRKAKMNIMLIDGNDGTVTQTKTLITAIEEGPDRMEVFDESLFKIMVNEIVASSDNILTFRLMNGIELKEIIERRSRK